jgi:hypothetical protein
VDWSTFLPAVIGICGLAGIVFSALSWRRNDTTAIVGQQDVILNEMRGLTDELRISRDECRAELERVRPRA